ncbi:MAG: transposase, partial [Methylococcales bacterium]
QPVSAPSAKQLQTLLSRIIKRILRVLTRQGYLIEEQGMTYLAETHSDLTLAPLQSAACTYRIALGPRAGQKVLTLKTVSTQAVQFTTELCSTEHGFSLHADVRCAANQRHQLERLCRYITRPAIANERLERNGAGDVVLQLKSPYQDGTTHIVLSPLEFMQRLAALVPRPRLNLIRCHGILAPNAKHRSEIIPEELVNVHPATDQPDETPCRPSATRISRARWLKRGFEFDLEHCPCPVGVT